MAILPPLFLRGESTASHRAVIQWLADHPRPTPAQLAEAGYVAPHWPKPWGLDASLADQWIISSAFNAHGVTVPHPSLEIGWIGPALLRSGTDAQRARYLPPMLAGSERWCRLHSEPEAGSDPSMIRTSARRSGNGWVINGQKVWTALAKPAAFGILLARTSPRNEDSDGLSLFIVAMDSPGITLRPISDMAGLGVLNEVFFDDVELPQDALVGAVGDGLALRRPRPPLPRVVTTAAVGYGSGLGIADLCRIYHDEQVSDSIKDRIVDLTVLLGTIESLAALDVIDQGVGAAGELAFREAIRPVLVDRSSKMWEEILSLLQDLTVPPVSVAALLERPMVVAGALIEPIFSHAGGTCDAHNAVVSSMLFNRRSRARDVLAPPI